MVIQGNFKYPVGQVVHGLVSVGTTTPVPVQVGEHPFRGRNGVLISLPPSSKASAVYVGGSDVSVGIGIPVASDSGVIIPLNSAGGAGKLYMVADASCKVNVVELIE